MTTRKTFVKYLLAAHSLIAAINLQAVNLLTSQGAWSTTDVVASSNSDSQNNTRNSGYFDIYAGGATFSSNLVSEYIAMRAAADNPQQNYTAGYTYSYQSLGYSLLPSHNSIFNVGLLANGVLTGDNVSGNNYMVSGIAGSNNISGELQVESGFAYLGQQIGMRISSQGIQTKWFADGSTSLSALLTNHAGFDGGSGAGALYSTSFSGSAQAINYDHVLDMELTLAGGAVIEADYLRLNNDTDGKNIASFGSATDTFRANTRYKITINANKQVNADATQNSIDIIMGDDTHIVTIPVPTSVTTLDFTINADDVGLAGEAFKFYIAASDLTTTGINQYRIYDFSIEAMQVPEPDSFAFWAASLTLTWIMIRRRFKATKAQV